ncbi:MAG: ATP-binding cassette domain-containing protein, partial [Parachlamydiales bacterium]
SGGEQQRLAIARALVMEPKYLFADEPTGSLDSLSSEQVMQILGKVNSELKTTILLVTHDQRCASLASRQVRLEDGRII